MTLAILLALIGFVLWVGPEAHRLTHNPLPDFVSASRAVVVWEMRCCDDGTVQLGTVTRMSGDVAVCAAYKSAVVDAVARWRFKPSDRWTGTILVRFDSKEGCT